MTEQQTCGKGLASRATLPAALSDIISALAAVLGFHQKSLDLTDENARIELREYVRLEQMGRAIAASLKSAADAMASERSLPMGRHDIGVLASSESAATFERFVQAEQALLDEMTAALERDRALLRSMRAGSS